MSNAYRCIYRFYDLSNLPSQSMDSKAIKMAELITNV